METGDLMETSRRTWSLMGSWLVNASCPVTRTWSLLVSWPLEGTVERSKVPTFRPCVPASTIQAFLCVQPLFPAGSQTMT